MAPIRWFPVLATAVVLVSACAGAEPSEALVRPEGSPVGLTVPVEYEVAPTDLDGITGVQLDRSTSASGLTRPVGRILHRVLPPEAVQNLARRDLRLLTADRLDPLAVSRSQPGAVQVLGYDEIDDAGWWGSRIRVLLATEQAGDVVVDRMVLVGRAGGDLVEVEFTCDTTCFETFGEEIDEILTSWTTEDQP